MIKPDCKIIAVDNDQIELDLLMSTLHLARIPCIPIKYNSGEDIAIKFSGIRIAFFDINLAEGNNSGSQLHSIISHALSQILDENNGPYALVFWTKHKVDITDIIAYIQDPKRDINIPTPLIIDSIDKSRITSIEELLPEINRVLSNSTLEILLDFEEKAQKSASQTINSVFSIIPKGDDKWGDNQHFNENFNMIFSKIAVSSLGYNHAKDNPDKAVYEALVPIISYNLLNTVESKWQTVLTKLVESDNKNQIKYPNGFKVSKLNSIFHIDKVIDNKRNRRGTVSEYKHTPIEANNRFDYIKNMYEECKNLFSKFITFDERNTPPILKEFIRSDSKFIVIEISSACDFSQEKPRNNKFVLGVLTSSKFYENIDKENISDAVFYKELPIISYNEEDFNLWLHLNYTLSDFEINKNIGSPLFVLKKEIMNMIGNRYANHISRIGITSF